MSDERIPFTGIAPGEHVTMTRQYFAEFLRDRALLVSLASLAASLRPLGVTFESGIRSTFIIAKLQEWHDDADAKGKLPPPVVASE